MPPLGRVRVPPVGGVATILFSRPYWRIDPTFIGILTGPTQARGTMKGTTTNVTGGTMEGMSVVVQSWQIGANIVVEASAESHAFLRAQRRAVGVETAASTDDGRDTKGFWWAGGTSAISVWSLPGRASSIRACREHLRHMA